MTAPCGKAPSCEECPFPDCTFDGMSQEEWAESQARDHEIRLDGKEANRRTTQRRKYRIANRDRLNAQRRARDSARRDLVNARNRVFYAEQKPRPLPAPWNR